MLTDEREVDVTPLPGTPTGSPDLEGALDPHAAPTVARAATARPSLVHQLEGELVRRRPTGSTARRA